MSAVAGVTHLEPAGLMAEQRRLVSAMRRRTTMSDEEIREMLGPFANHAYETGFKNGFGTGFSDGEREAVEACRLWRACALIGAAVNLAWALYAAVG